MIKSFPFIKISFHKSFSCLGEGKLYTLLPVTSFLVSSNHIKCHLLCKSFYKNLISPPKLCISLIFFFFLLTMRFNNSVRASLSPFTQLVSWWQGLYLIHLYNASISQRVGVFKNLVESNWAYIIFQKYRISFKFQGSPNWLGVSALENQYII